MRRRQPKILNLALQGGGTHGAFTWGVLERLLDEEDIEIERISGTSAGALNGAALASGHAHDGRRGAKRQLEQLWTRVAQAALPITLLAAPLRKPGMGLWDDAMPLVSPYQMNPLGISPLRRVLESVVDIDAVKGASGPRLYVNAINVRTAQSRVFGPGDMSFDALLASACAPLMFQAVEIEGDAYWDGSYGANPMLSPLYEGKPEADIFMIELTPLERPETPTTAKNILNRINEIASISGLVTELRALDFVNRSVPGSALRLHVLSMPEVVDVMALEPSVKRSVGMELFEALRRSGHGACDRWLSKHGAQIGVKPSADLHAKYLAPYAQGATPAV